MISEELFKGFTNQKVSSLLKQLVDTGVVSKEVDKKVSYFYIPKDTVVVEELGDAELEEEELVETLEEEEE